MMWFLFDFKAHAYDDESPVRGSTAVGAHLGRCGIEVKGSVATREVPDAELYPPEACTSCQLVIGLADVVEEPFDVARGRGYVPAGPKD